MHYVCWSHLAMLNKKQSKDNCIKSCFIVLKGRCRKQSTSEVIDWCLFGLNERRWLNFQCTVWSSLSIALAWYGKIREVHTKMREKREENSRGSERKAGKCFHPRSHTSHPKHRNKRGDFPAANLESHSSAKHELSEKFIIVFRHIYFFPLWSSSLFLVCAAST